MTKLKLVVAFSCVVMFNMSSVIAATKSAAHVQTVGVASTNNDVDDFELLAQQAYDNGVLQGNEFGLQKPSFSERILRRLGNVIAKLSVVKNRIVKKIKNVRA